MKKNFGKHKSVFGTVELPMTPEQKQVALKKVICRPLDVRLLQWTHERKPQDAYLIACLRPTGMAIQNLDGTWGGQVEWDGIVGPHFSSLKEVEEYLQE